jgi:glycosyltransferase involved in cell wall biosynthesis
VDELSVNAGNQRQFAGRISAPQVSVVIPTHNRAHRLGGLLNDLVRQNARGVTYEVIVVDNRSRDDTYRVVDAVARTTSIVRYSYEPQQGASCARNHGVVLARAPIVAFIDDDVRPSPDWVWSIWSAFQGHPEIDCVGGRVEPRWPRTPPARLTRQHWPPLALQVGRGDAPYLDRDHASACLITANFACRATVFAEVGGFSPAYQRDEDREFNLRLWRAGKRGRYDDSIVSFAEVQSERLTKRYHRAWYGVTGCSHARMRYREIIDREGRMQDLGSTRGWYVLGAPGYLYRELLPHVLRWSALMLGGASDQAFYEECRARYLWAYLKTRWIACLTSIAARGVELIGRRTTRSHAPV